MSVAGWVWINSLYFVIWLLAREKMTPLLFGIMV